MAISRDVARIRSTEPKPPTVEALEISLSKAARIVERHGENYLPIFLLIEEALVLARDKRDAMARVRALASDRIRKSECKAFSWVAAGTLQVERG